MKKLWIGLWIGLVAAGGRAATNDTELPQTTEIIGLLKAHYVDSDRLDQQRLTDATVAGLLAALGPGAQLLTAEQAQSNVVAITSSRVAGEPLARAEVIDPKIGYIRLAEVAEDTAAALDAELKKFQDARVTGYVLDLRFADGTNYAAAAAVASRFLKGQPELFHWKEAGRSLQAFRATPTGRALPTEQGEAPLMMLVNAQTRGAAEVLAGALRAQDRCIVIGSRTAGTAVAWEDLKLGDGRILRVATAKIALPGGGEVFPGGVPPDIAVKIDPKTERDVVLHAQPNVTLTASLQPAETRKALREADLVKVFRGEALEAPPLALNTNSVEDAEPAATVTSTNKPAAAPRVGNGSPGEVRDVVLQRAVDILKGIRVLLSAR